MKNRDDLDNFYSNVNECLKEIEDGQEFPKYYYNSSAAGDNEVYQKNIAETKIFDHEWIDTVESYFPSIEKITKNPKSFIKYEEEIVDVERAKKTTSRSIRHLASNTHLIKDIDKDENVTPKKILNIFTEQDYEIYENRFLMTLINRLFLFVRHRYNIIKSNVESFQKDHVNYTSKFDINNTSVSLNIDMLVKKDLDNQGVNIENHKLLERVEKLNALVGALKNSQFMIKLAKARPVQPPIMKTNTILKNAEFKNAYNLWLFLDKYNTLAYDITVKETEIKFTDDFITQLQRIGLLAYSTIIANNNKRKEIYNIDEKHSQYVRKRTKIARKHAADFVDRPDLIVVEDNYINEYYLNKYKSIFDSKVELEQQENDVSYEFAVKKAIKQTTDITNSLYDAVFKFGEETTDIFNKLVTKEDLDREAEEKKMQIKFAKTLREVKEVDFNNALRLEKRLLKEHEKINLKVIRRDQELINNEALAEKKKKMASEIEQIKEANKKIKGEVNSLDELLAAKETLKNSFSVEKENIIQEAKAELLAFEEEEKLRIERELEEENKRFEIMKEQIRIEREQLNAELKAFKESITNERKALKTENSQKLKDLKTKLSKERTEKLAKIRDENRKTLATETKKVQTSIKKQKENAVLKTEAYKKELDEQLVIFEKEYQNETEKLLREEKKNLKTNAPVAKRKTAAKPATATKKKVADKPTTTSTTKKPANKPVTTAKKKPAARPKQIPILRGLTEEELQRERERIAVSKTEQYYRENPDGIIPEQQ